MNPIQKILLLGLPEPVGSALGLLATADQCFEQRADATGLGAAALGGYGLALIGAHALRQRSDNQLVRQLSQQLPCIAVVDYSQLPLAIEAIKAGAQDYLLCPVDGHDLQDAIQRLYHSGSVEAGPVFRADSTRAVFEFARKVATSAASVLVSGESGTGKEVLARYIHEQSPRHDKPFVAINCAAIPETMLESILFGYEKGAFTGAATARAGKFEQANGGTLLLDELSEMDISLQAKLLRVLQERETERLGGSRSIPLDVRVIATTNRDLKREVQCGRFREDLYYRLNVFPLTLPPLRDRREDVAPLAEMFLQKYSEGSRRQFSHAALARLEAHYWPGNVRELENTVQRALIMADGPVITPEQLLFEYSDSAARPSSGPALPSGAVSASAATAPPAAADERPGLEGNLKQREKDMILGAISNHQTRKEAAENLGISPRTLRYKLAKFKKQGAEQSP